MYTHILAATDGSELGCRAVRKAAQLARVSGLPLTLGYVGVRDVAPLYTGDIVPGPLLVPLEEQDEQIRQTGQDILERSARVAAEEGVQCALAFTLEDAPFQGLIQLAEKHGCDLIVIASHRRSALAAWLLGSETQKLLSHGAFDTLVVR